MDTARARIKKLARLVIKSETRRARHSEDGAATELHWGRGLIVRLLGVSGRASTADAAATPDIVLGEHIVRREDTCSRWVVLGHSRIAGRLPLVCTLVRTLHFKF